MRRGKNNKVWHLLMLMFSDEPAYVVVDGDSFSNVVFHSQSTRGLNFSLNPLFIYNFAKKLIRKLKVYKLKVIGVYFDSLSNPDKLPTYIKRRKSSENESIKFWDSDLKKKGRRTNFLGF